MLTTMCNMILKKGITGFYDSKSPPVPEIDFKRFKTLCHTIDSCTQRRLIDIKSNPNCNYYSAEFDISSGIIYILMNKYYPIVAFTEEINFGNFTFKDINDLNYLLTDYEVISADILNGSIDNVVNELSEPEMNQVKYCNPVSVGNIIFNCWD